MKENCFMLACSFIVLMLLLSQHCKVHATFVLLDMQMKVVCHMSYQFNIGQLVFREISFCQLWLDSFQMTSAVGREVVTAT